MLSIEPANLIFSCSSGHSLQARYTDFFAFYRQQLFKLAKNPNNLYLHTQLIYSLNKEPLCSRDMLFGALVDLFIVLGENGKALKKRLLRQHNPVLNPQDRHFLTQYLSCALTAHTAITHSGHSLFCQNYLGSNNPIQKLKSQQEAALSVYQQALQLLEYGDLTEASVLLQRALQEQPDNQQIAEELLAIYLHHNNQHEIEIMRDWFFQQNLPLPDSWPLM